MRLTLELFGVVQGVGLRPAVLRLATGAGLGGWVQNRSGSVWLCLEGPEAQVERFVAELPGRLGAPARVDRIDRADRADRADRVDRTDASAPEPASGELRFEIRPSLGDAGLGVSIPADLAACALCLAEVRDPGARRYGYPFTTCTACGPRYTVVSATPYDRERTTLARFPLCPDCRREYDDPTDRRFHAESIACPACGPRLWLLGPGGEPVAGDPLRGARAALARGAIVALRGVGGFLLAADALNADALVRLRARKSRPHKPFAVMGASLAVLRRQGLISELAALALGSPAGPIVILDAAPTSCAPLALLTPDAPTLGVMLPTSPLQDLLATPLAGDPTPAFDLLVMTSGNRAGEPICTGNEEALGRLRGIADLFLCHDREINLRCDDSLCVPVHGRLQLWRRARGHAPAPVRLAAPLGRRVLALGGELKNTVAVGSGNEVVLSPHLGDLGSPEALAAHERLARELPLFLHQPPEVLAVDLHPDYHATRHGRALAAATGLPLVAVQHHHAHAAAAMAEHGLGEALALVFDGTGLGTDGAIWGAELLQVRLHADGAQSPPAQAATAPPPDAATGSPAAPHADAATGSPATGPAAPHAAAPGFVRLGTFAPVCLPGGDAAVGEPARQLVGRLVAAGLTLPESWRLRLGVSAEQVEVWQHQCVQGLNAPLTHAAGRLFDAVAAAVGLAPQTITYEAQAAVRLEAAARRATQPVAPLPFGLRLVGELLLIDWSPSFEALVHRALEPQRDAAALHRAVAAAALVLARHGRELTGLAAVVLSGGVFANRLLSAEVLDLLVAEGFKPYPQLLVPPNDGGLSLGQAVVAGGVPGVSP